MRAFICSIPLLCGCSTSAVRCDAHLQPINAPALSLPVASAKAEAASAKAAVAAVKSADVRSAP